MRLLVAVLAACNGTPPPACPGAQPHRSLVEGFCTANEADRCFYDQSPLDGF
jgi:hypothetical protein